VEISKALWCGIEDAPKTEAGNRSICISPLLGAALKEYLGDRKDGYVFQTSESSPWGCQQHSCTKVEQGT